MINKNSKKHRIRKNKKLQRQLLSKKQINDYSFNILKNLLTLVDFKEISIIHSFLPIRENKEVDTFLILSALKDLFSNLKFATPILQDSGEDFEHWTFSLETVFQLNKYLTPEPATKEQRVGLDQIDIILVPLLAFDLKGDRIGYGKGTYDKFLKGVNEHCLEIGLGLEICKVDLIPAEEHDMKLDAVITEKSTYIFSDKIRKS